MSKINLIISIFIFSILLGITSTIKNKTRIMDGAFIGSNTALVAPVTIGERAITGAGSVITKDVEADALAITRGPQEQRAGWALKYRIQKQKFLLLQ